MTTTPAHIAKHLRELHFGGNTTGANLRDAVSGLNWQQATAKIGSFNTIAVLVFHVNYYVSAVLKVMQGGPLDAHDSLSFDLSPISNENGWQELVAKCLGDAEALAALLEQMPEERLWEDFVKEKYGPYYRNLHGVIEHTYYHLGQITLLKKLLQDQGL